MRTPDFSKLECDDEGARLGSSFASGVHLNGHFCKYRWWVFWRGSACDGAVFLDDRFAMSTAVAMQLLETLSFAGERHWIYNQQIPRNEPGVKPFDHSSIRWRGVEFAVAFDTDPDPEWHSHR